MWRITRKIRGIRHIRVLRVKGLENDRTGSTHELRIFLAYCFWFSFKIHGLDGLFSVIIPHHPQFTQAGGKYVEGREFGCHQQTGR
jgi:hypothetical protein